MNWDDLRFLLAVARSQTLTDAARTLGVNQTTVTRRLQGLQETLGIRLFDRAAEGILTTEAGENMVEGAVRIERILAELDRRVQGGDARLTGMLRVTTIDTVGLFDTALFADFTARYPGIELELSVGYDPRNLTRREADIALRWTNTPPEHLVGRRVARAEYAVYSSRTLLDRLGRDLPLADYPWLGWDDSIHARLTHNWMREHVPNARVACRYDSATAKFAATQAGVGVTFLPCAYADADPNLERLRAVEPGFGYDIWVLTHPDLRGNARVRAFLDEASQYYRDRGDQFAGLCASHS